MFLVRVFDVRVVGLEFRVGWRIVMILVLRLLGFLISVEILIFGCDDMVVLL